jgi:hypothetical protein
MQSKCIVYPWSGTVSQYLQSSIYPLKRRGNSFMWPVLTLIKDYAFEQLPLVFKFSLYKQNVCQYEYMYINKFLSKFQCFVLYQTKIWFKWSKDLYSRKDMNLSNRRDFEDQKGKSINVNYWWNMGDTSTKSRYFINDWYLGQIFSLYTCNYGYESREI